MKKFGLILISFWVSANLQANGISRNATCQELLNNQWLTANVALNINQLAYFPGDRKVASQQIMHGLIADLKNPNLDFAYFEQYFRAHDVSLYLVANSEPLGKGHRVGYSEEMGKLKGSPAKYHLWVGVKGKAEADALKASLGISDEENLLRLRETGFIIVEQLQTAQSSRPVSRIYRASFESAQTQGKRPFNPENN